MTEITHIGIDFDDTTSRTEEACFLLENAVLGEMGRTPMSRETHLATWGHPLERAILERSPGVDIAHFQAVFGPMFRRWVEDGRLDTVPAENYQAIDDLRAQGRQFFVLTSRTREEVAHLVADGHPLSERLVGFYHLDNTHGFAKPHPRVFDQPVQDHDLRAGKWAYVGDSRSDAAAAAARGAFVIINLESGLRRIEDFSDLVVHAFIRRFTDLPHAIAMLEAAT